MFSVNEWKRRIALYICAGGDHIIRCASKEFILDQIGGRHDQNARIAFDEFEQDGYIEYFSNQYYTVDFDRRDEFMMFALQESELEIAKAQPLEDEFKGLKYLFARASDWKGSNRRHFHFCVKENDPAYWVILAKKKGIGKSQPLYLGSFDNPKDKLARIWAATKKAAEQNSEHVFIQHDAEILDLRACGTGRQFSRAAFEIFREYKLIVSVGKRRKGILYKLTGKEPSSIEMIK
jgi:hypothetical protein